MPIAADPVVVLLRAEEFFVDPTLGQGKVWIFRRYRFSLVQMSAARNARLDNCLLAQHEMFGVGGTVCLG